jgi:hypothetical protein
MYMEKEQKKHTLLRRQPWFEAVYKIGVGIKGFDGLVELVVGIALIVSKS